jgi:hypothetical protein
MADDQWRRKTWHSLLSIRFDAVAKPAYHLQSQLIFIGFENANIRKSSPAAGLHAD